MSVRVAVIGAGVMGADHAQIFARDVPGAVLQVVCDASAERAETVANACGAADISSDPEAVVARSDVDAVLIASPDHTHAPLSIQAIKLGKPVLCEKPLAPGSAEALTVVHAEAEAGRHLVQAGYMRRFDPPYAEMKGALDAGLIGRAVMMHNFHRNVVAPPHFTGVMAITNSAPHEFDIARYVLGAELTSISAYQPANVDASQPGAPVVMVITTDAGQLVTVEVNVNATYGYHVRGELVGETGSLDLGTPVNLRINTELSMQERLAADWRPRFADAYRLQNQAFVRFCETGTLAPEAATAWDGFVATVVAEAGAQALGERHRVCIALPEKPALYQA